ncbi:MAG: hypothetical protein RTU30_15785 [Candidatus Thorarchaeota archaeon]
MSDSPLTEWTFLIGDWKGVSEGKYDEEGVIQSSVSFSQEPSERYFMGRHKVHKDGDFVNSSISFMFFDGTDKKFRRKTVFSYGFINNEVEYFRDEKEIRFEVEVEPFHPGFVGLRWRSYIKRISETEIAMGLESVKEGEEFTNYGETTYKRV